MNGIKTMMNRKNTNHREKKSETEIKVNNLKKFLYKITASVQKAQIAFCINQYIS